LTPRPAETASVTGATKCAERRMSAAAANRADERARIRAWAGEQRERARRLQAESKAIREWAANAEKEACSKGDVPPPKGR
jgi:hypothetical protein